MSADKTAEAGARFAWQCERCGWQVLDPELALAEVHCLCGQGRGSWYATKAVRWPAEYLALWDALRTCLATEDALREAEVFTEPRGAARRAKFARLQQEFDDARSAARLALRHAGEEVSR